MAHFDLLVKGGEVIDPAAGVRGRLDVAIVGDRIAAVDRDIPPTAARVVVDASGHLVTPGLIDLHTHVFWGANYFGVDADSIAWRSGVTTWVDAGSAGAFSLPAFREYVVKPAASRILSFINISYLGLAGLNYDEYCNLDACDVPLLRRVVDLNRDLVLGIKTRMGREGVCYRGLEPLRRALRAGEETGLPVMCHISDAPPPVEAVLALLRRGDIVTHSFTGLGERLVGDDGHVLPAALAARERGVLFDIGHGSGSFSFETAEALAADGFWPDFISTDLHQVSLAGPNLLDPLAQEFVARVRGDGSPQFTLLTVMSKFLHLGLGLEDVIAAVTARPAALLGKAGHLGTLAPGAAADIAVLAIDEGSFRLHDIHGNVRDASRLFRCARTIRGGREMPHKEVPPPPPWIMLVDREQSAPGNG